MKSYHLKVFFLVIIYLLLGIIGVIMRKNTDIWMTQANIFIAAMFIIGHINEKIKL